MDKIKLNYIVNIGLLISFLVVLVTAILKWPGLIRKSTLPITNISFLHDWSGVVMTALVLIHLILNWNWIVAVTKKYFKK